MINLKFTDTNFYYKKDKPIFTKLNLELKSNFISLVGPDGAGKSTLLKLIAKVLKPTSGTCIFENDAKKTTSIGYMSQRLGLYEELSVIDNLNFMCAVKDYDPKIHRQELLTLLNRVGLLKFKDYAVSALSGGMKQKLALCCTLATKPSCLILDEPTVGVDPLSRQDIWQIIHEYLDNNEVFCIFSTAYLEEAQAADFCIFLQDGKIVNSANPQELLQKLKDRTFILDSNYHYQKLLRLLLNRSSMLADPYLSDICPRAGKIDVLTKKQFTKDELIDHFKDIFLKNDCDVNFTLTARTPCLEDVYIALNEHSDDKNSVKITNDDLKEASLVNANTASDEEIIKVQDIKKTFGSFTAVHKSTFSVKKGEIFGLLGPNGAGKTTTFRMICALLNPSSGHISINGIDLTKAKSVVREQIGYVSQKFSLYRKMTLWQNLNYFAGSYGLFGVHKIKRLNFLLADFNLTAFKDVLAEDLPFGIQRQLSMACALIHEPKILFLDEATSGADPIARRVFWQRILELANIGTSVIVTTHFMEEAEYCDRFLIQDQGRILALGKPDDICDVNGRRTSIEEAFIRKIIEFRKTQEGPHESSAS